MNFAFAASAARLEMVYLKACCCKMKQAKHIAVDARLVLSGERA